jgi:Na+-translocating ferredoxin:NAD+ oxidoreductase RnfD subunit
MRFPTLSSPHLTGPNSTTQVMAEVLLALVPGIAALVWYFGWGVVINVALASVVASTPIQRSPKCWLAMTRVIVSTAAGFPPC